MNHEKIKGLEEIISRDYQNIAGMVVLKNGKTEYENYFNGYTADNTLHVYSVTKSIFSALVGIAIHRGYIKSVNQKVLEFLPDYKVPKGEGTIQHVTIRDMLTMTAPYKYEVEPYEAFFASENWMKFALDLLGGNGKIGEFVYSAIAGTHILSGILVKAVGKPVLDFAVEALFSPLGINVPCNVLLRTKEEHIAVMNSKTTCGWAVDPQGINPASWGLFLTPVDMAKIGKLYLDKGMLNGKQIVPAGWIDESTRAHSRWNEANLSYGYLWWLIDEKEGACAAMGDGGNVIYFNTKKNIVVAIASLFVQNAKDRITLIQQHIEPVFMN